MHNLWKNNKAGKIPHSFNTTLTQWFNEQNSYNFFFNFHLGQCNPSQEESKLVFKSSILPQNRAYHMASQVC